MPQSYYDCILHYTLDILGLYIDMTACQSTWLLLNSIIYINLKIPEHKNISSDWLKGDVPIQFQSLTVHKSPGQGDTIQVKVT